MATNIYNLHNEGIKGHYDFNFESDLISTGMYEFLKATNLECPGNSYDEFKEAMNQGGHKKWEEMWTLLNENTKIDDNIVSCHTKFFPTLAEVKSRISRGTWVLGLSPDEKIDSYDSIAVFKNGKCEYFEFPENETYVTITLRLID